MKKAQAILFLLLALSLSTLGACVENRPIEDPPLTEPEARVYYDSFDEVWRAVQLALRKYPVHLNNIESGTLETDYIKGDKLFTEPVEGRMKAGMRYKLTIRAVKGRIDEKSAIKIVCIKTPEVQRDFFTGYQPITTNGLEEKTILYRIGRYLEMERILSKVQPN
jgi:hypothetical protein